MVLHLREKGAKELWCFHQPLSNPASCQVPSVCLSGFIHIPEDLTHLSFLTFGETLISFHCSQCHEAIKQALCCGRVKVFFCAVIFRIF